MDMFAEAAKIRNSAVLTLHGSADAVIPVEDAHELYRRMGEGEGERPQRHSLVVVEGADHNFRQPAAADQLVLRVVEHLTAPGGDSAGGGP